MPKGLMVAIGIPKGGGGKPDIGSPGGLDEPMPKRGAMAPQQQEAESPEEDQAEEKATPEEVGYHSGSETCQSCKFMGDDGDCKRWGFDVDPGGWCHAWASGQQEMGGGQEEAAEGDDMGGSAGYDHGQ